MISGISSDGQWVLCFDNGPPPQALLNRLNAAAGV
jgi:hypothetical protein